MFVLIAYVLPYYYVCKIDCLMGIMAVMNVLYPDIVSLVISLLSIQCSAGTLPCCCCRIGLFTVFII